MPLSHRAFISPKTDMHNSLPVIKARDSRLRAFGAPSICVRTRGVSTRAHPYVQMAIEINGLHKGFIRGLWRIKTPLEKKKLCPND